MKITDKQLTAMLKDISKLYPHDPEAAHGAADDALLFALKELGFPKSVKTFKTMKKYYA